MCEEIDFSRDEQDFLQHLLAFILINDNMIENNLREESMSFRNEQLYQRSSVVLEID